MDQLTKKLPKSNTWKGLKKKLIKLGCASAIALTLSSCGAKESDVTKTAKSHDNDVENVTTAKENVTDKEEALKKATIDLQDARQELIDAQKKEQESKKETKQKANSL